MFHFPPVLNLIGTDASSKIEAVAYSSILNIDLKTSILIYFYCVRTTDKNATICLGFGVKFSLELKIFIAFGEIKKRPFLLLLLLAIIAPSFVSAPQFARLKFASF
ncbi:MAG: hypothetical protein ACTTIM_01835 [Campylobacter sp.]